MIIVCGGIKGGSGKTTVATNLAVIRAGQGSDVLLIDADDQETSTDFTTQRAEQRERGDDREDQGAEAAVHRRRLQGWASRGGGASRSGVPPYAWPEAPARRKPKMRAVTTEAAARM